MRRLGFFLFPGLLTIGVEGQTLAELPVHGAASSSTNIFFSWHGRKEVPITTVLCTTKPLPVESLPDTQINTETPTSGDKRHYYLSSATVPAESYINLSIPHMDTECTGIRVGNCSIFLNQITKQNFSLRQRGGDCYSVFSANYTVTDSERGFVINMLGDRNDSDCSTSVRGCSGSKAHEGTSQSNESSENMEYDSGGEDDEDDDDGGKPPFINYEKSLVDSDPLAGKKREWIAFFRIFLALGNTPFTPLAELLARQPDLTKNVLGISSHSIGKNFFRKMFRESSSASHLAPDDFLLRKSQPLSDLTKILEKSASQPDVRTTGRTSFLWECRLMALYSAVAHDSDHEPSTLINALAQTSNHVELLADANEILESNSPKKTPDN